MKRIFTLFFIILIPVAGSYAKKKITGYFVTHAEDTIKCTFLVPFSFFTGEPNYEQLQYKISYLDAKGGKSKFRPHEIKAYVLEVDGKKITYLSRKNDLEIMQSIFAANEHIFLRLRIDGPLKMFDYFIKRQAGGIYNPAMGAVSPGVSYVDENYCLQKGEGPLTYIRRLSFKKDLSKYLSDYPQLAQKILDKEYKKGDIDIIVQEYNKYVLMENGQESKNGY